MQNESYPENILWGTKMISNEKVMRQNRKQ